MTQAEIVAVFEGIADIMQIRGDEPRKIQAYRWAARVLDTLQEDIQLLYEQNRLIEIQGIGRSIVEKIVELINTGKCQYYEELKASIPSGVLDLMSISGVGPSTAGKLYHELNIDNLEALQQALDEQKLRNLKGMGKKTEEKIRSGLEALLRHRQRRLMGYVLPIVELVSDRLRKAVSSCSQISITGELRRRTETIRDAEIVAVCSDPAEVRNTLADMEWVEEVYSDWTNSGGSARLIGEVELHIRLTNPEDFGVDLIYFTGSEDHIVELNKRAKQLGLEPFNPGSLTIWTKGKSEEEIYTTLQLPFIIPEIREGAGEIQAAMSGQLPEPINMGDIRGDLHVHSTWSDGHGTITAMAEAAKSMGYEYIAFCDHSISSKIANGLDVERILNKMIDIREINEKISGIEVFMGAEVDILKDGSLDYPDEILEKLDVVVASVHSGFSMDEAKMTQRIISAIENRFVHIIGHPSGRLLGRRDPYQVNMDAIIDAAAENNKSLEINTYPDRLDLKDIHAHKAKERNIMLAINTDAHSIDDLNLIIYGVYTARRGWLEKKDVLNTLPLTELMKWLRR